MNKLFEKLFKNGVKSIQTVGYNGARTVDQEAKFFKTNYRISSNKTHGYYFFTRPSNAGIIRMQVLIEGWYYYQSFLNFYNKT